MERRRRTALNRTSMTLLKTAQDLWRISLLMKQDELLLVTPTASKNEGRINNISDDDIIVTFLLSSLQCVKLEHLNIKWD